MKMLGRFVILGSVAVLALCPAARGQCHYVATAIPAPLCPPFGTPAILQGLALSDSGEVVGWYKSCADLDNVAFRWSVESGFDSINVDLDGYNWSELTSVNADGHVVGNVSYFAAVPERGFVMPDPQTTIEIAIPPDGVITHASAINRWGDATGYWRQGNPESDRGFIWSKGSFVDLGDMMPPSFFLRPFDINDLGDVVGWRKEQLANQREAFLLSGDETTFLGPIPGGISSEARAINNHGVVIGYGARIGAQGQNLVRGFLWKDGVFLSVNEPLDGFDHLWLADVNDHNTAVGSVTCSPLCGSVAVILVAGTVYELNDLLIEPFSSNLSEARAINNLGQILCAGYPQSLLTPVDPPFTDLDGDCSTGFNDLVILLSRWATSGEGADFNGDGAVGFYDLVTLLLNWG